MKQKWISLLLALALLASMCAVTAAAGQEPAPPAETAGEPAEAAPEGESPDGEAPEEEPVSPAGPDGAEDIRGSALDEKTQKLLDKVTTQPEPLSSIAFTEVEQRMRESCLSLKALEETVLMLEEMDYDDLYEDLREKLNGIAQGQWFMVQQGASDSYAYAALGQQYDALRERFDAIKDGELQEDNADAAWQLNSAEDQLVMAGESLYVALSAMETQEASTQRKLAALNRSVEEMELRYQLGQISALQLSQTRAGQTSLVSGLETLRMNISTCKMQLESLLGAELTGQLALSALPEVTEKDLSALDVEKDLLTAKANSYSLHEAALTLADAREDYVDAGGDSPSRPEKLEYQQAKRAWSSAQYTYNSTLQEYELKFRTLYAQVLDYQQILTAAKVSLECEKQSFAASELKYQQGAISKNTYLTAQDDLRAAEETVQSASNDLFASYNTYCWAVRHGILN